MVQPRSVYGAIALGAVLIALGLLVEEVTTILLAVTFTVIVSLPLDAAATALERRGVPRALGALFALIAGLTVAGLIIAFLVPPISGQLTDLINATPNVVHTIEVKLGHVIGVRPGRLSAHVQHDLETFAHHPSQLLGPIATIGIGIATVLGGIVLALMTAYFIAVNPRPLVDGIVSVFPNRRPQAQRVLSRLRVAWLGWLRGLAISMVIIGVLLYLALGPLIGLPYALSFAVLSGVGEVVPYLGALATGVPPVALALTISPGTALAVLVAYIAIHQIEANIVSPLVMARSVHLHPAVIALGVVAVGQVFGFLGLMIAVPILSAIVALVEELWVRPQERLWRRSTPSPRGHVESPAVTFTSPSQPRR